MTCDVLVPILLYPDAPTPEHALEAVRLAKALGGSATALLVEMTLPRLEGHWGAGLAGVPGMVAELEKRQHATLTALRPHLEAICDVTALKVPQAQAGQVLSLRARARDLAVVSTETVEGRELGQELVFDSGRPVVVVPPRKNSSSIQKVAIAWDGSRAAARAVHDAMPWIQAASSITILTAMEDKWIADQSVANLTGYLGRKGLKANAEGISAKGRGIGKALQEEALAQDADMLVMGAFGHSRLRDFILGGATAGVFEETQLSVFMSH